MEMKQLSRAERNNNPGNVRNNTQHFIGEVVPSQDKAFKQFIDMEHGFRAMWALLKTYYHVHRLRTINDILSRYAPTQDHNNTKAYAEFVAAKAGKKVDERLYYNYDSMGRVVLAMAEYESGYVRPEWEACCKQGYELLKADRLKELERKNKGRQK